MRDDIGSVMAQRSKAGVALLLGSCLLAACHPVKPAAPPPPATARPGAATTIYLARRAWHIDVGFAVADLGSPLKSLGAQFPRAKYLFFGFGDRHYLQAKSHNVPVLLGALWPGPALILVTGIEGDPRAAFGTSQVIAFEVPSNEALSAQAYVWKSLISTVQSPGPYEGSLYFDAVARYSALHTCNTWAAETLKAAGLPVRTHLVVLAGQLWPSALRLAAQAGDAGVLAP